MNGITQRTDGDVENARGARLNDGREKLTRQFLSNCYEKMTKSENFVEK